MKGAQDVTMLTTVIDVFFRFSLDSAMGQHYSAQGGGDSEYVQAVST